jgi:hypothetical protein
MVKLIMCCSKCYARYIKAKRKQQEQLELEWMIYKWVEMVEES